MNDLKKIFFGWVLGLVSSVLVFYLQNRHSKIKKIKNLLIIFEALKIDWNNFKNEDDLSRLQFRVENMLDNLNKVMPQFLDLGDLKITHSFFSLKKELNGFLLPIMKSERGRLHYYRDDIDKIFSDEYIAKLNNQYGACDLKLHNDKKS